MMEKSLIPTLLVCFLSLFGLLRLIGICICCFLELFLKLYQLLLDIVWGQICRAKSNKQDSTEETMLQRFNERTAPPLLV